MTVKEKLLSVPEFVRELHLAEERFLEVLISSFDIHRRRPPAAGFELRVSFDERTPAVWDRRGVRHLREKVLSPRKREEYQKELDAFLYGRGAGTHAPSEYDFTDDDFVFRYVSGGTLPVVRFAGDPAEKAYYCLTYREIEPIGWNLFNGGSDSRDEMTDPEQTVRRELHEELIIVDPTAKLRYVFPSGNGRARDLPVNAMARMLLDKLAPNKYLKDSAVADVDMVWVEGPDSVRIRMGDGEPVTRGGFFLNINGSDFGIELDKVAQITLPKTAVMFFGETDRGHLLNCPIGLFDVSRFSPDMDPEDLQREAFRPDLFFFNGKRHRVGEIDRVLAGPFLGQLRGHLWPDALAKFEACLRDEARYALCPVTARMILRHRRWKPEKEDDDGVVMPGTGDYDWATQAELCRAMTDVLGEGDDPADSGGADDGGAPNKSTLSRAIRKGLIETNGKSGRGGLVSVDSFKAWIAKKRMLDNQEVRQLENAVIGEIRKRAR